MGLMDQLRDYTAQTQALHWEGTFAEYLAKVRETPAIAQLAHARLNAMIQAAGKTRTPDGPHYSFFDGHLIGADAALRAIMEYLEGAAAGLDVRKRVLLLIGPPASGKSSLLILLKRALEAYSRTEAGAVYGIQGCPMHEEPLHLIPRPLREAATQDLGMTIEGDLCPVCQQRIQAGEPIDSFRVERLLISEKDRVGIGTYQPTHEKNMDLADLVGSMNFGTITQYGSEADPRAYDFTGEFNRASRGLIELIESLKMPREFLYSLLTLAQERHIKAPRFALIYADEVIISHSNLHEYAKFLADKGNEALANRVYVVHMPYALKTDDEVAIYQHMLAETTAIQGTHIAPHTLHALARFIILTRLIPSKKQGDVDLWTKIRLYNAEAIGEYTDASVRELRTEFPNEGLSGLSPRNALNVLTHAMGLTSDPCVNPMDVLLAIREDIRGEKFLSATDDKAKEQLQTFIQQVRAELDRQVREDVQTAFIQAFDDNAQAAFDTYLENAEAWDNKDQIRDPVSHDLRDPDTVYLRRIEGYTGVSESAATAFRSEILKKRGSVLAKGQSFRWDAHPRLAQGIRDMLFADAKTVMIGTLTARTPDPKQHRRLQDVESRLIADRGYCVHCAQAAMNYTGYLLQHAEADKK